MKPCTPYDKFFTFKQQQCVANLSLPTPFAPQEKKKIKTPQHLLSSPNTEYNDLDTVYDLISLSPHKLLSVSLL